MVLVSVVAFRLRQASPVWLDDWLGLTPPRVRGARTLAVWGWLQGLVFLPVLALGIRQGPGPALELFGVLTLLSVVLSVLATWTSGWRRWGWAAYLPLAVMIWAAATAGSVS